jgi:hypothetical protein
MEDHRRGPGRDLGDERAEPAAQIVAQVTGFDAGSLGGRQAQRGGQPAAAVLVLGRRGTR